MSTFAQSDMHQFRPWQLMSYSGQINLRGNYRETESWLKDAYTKNSDAFLNGIFQLRTQSFFVHPNFMTLNLNGIYNTNALRNNTIGIPYYSEKNNNEALEGSAVFFKKRNFNLVANGSFYNSVQNIENLARTETKSNFFGSAFSYNNNVLPFSLSFTKQKTDEHVVDAQRSFKLDQRIYQATADKSFSSFNHHSLSFQRTETTSDQTDVGFVNPLHAVNALNQLNLNDDLVFGPRKSIAFSSGFSNSEQTGNTLYRNLSVMENLAVKLPMRFVLNDSYNYRRVRQDASEIDYQVFQSTLSHQLFESLNSRLLYEHRITDQAAYREQRDKTGIELRYVKKIPTGKFNLYYAYYREYQTAKAPSVTLNVVREEYVLTDNQITLLKNQNVIMQSVVVRDITGAITYQQGVDYLLVEKDPYIEIMRVPGGLIPNNASVFIDYTAIHPVFYQYNLNNHSLNADVSVFKNKLDVYYRLYAQRYDNQSNTENLVLNIFSRHVTGAKVDFNFINGGAEYEYCKSNLFPYEGMRYFVGMQYMYKNLSFILNGNFTNYQVNNENTRRRDSDLSSKIAYGIVKNVKVSADYMYRATKGSGINLDIQTTRFEITANLHKLFLSAGSEFYWNKDVNSKINFKEQYIQLTRNF